MICRVNLELDGFVVREAGTLEQARKELSDGRVDVVLLDVHVASESGVEFLRELHEEHPSVAVALLTGSVGTPALDDVDPDAVIAKPFTIERLVATVQELALRTPRDAR